MITKIKHEANGVSLWKIEESTSKGEMYYFNLFQRFPGTFEYIIININLKWYSGGTVEDKSSDSMNLTIKKILDKNNIKLKKITPIYEIDDNLLTNLIFKFNIFI